MEIVPQFRPPSGSELEDWSRTDEHQGRSGNKNAYRTAGAGCAPGPRRAEENDLSRSHQTVSARDSSRRTMRYQTPASGFAPHTHQIAQNESVDPCRAPRHPGSVTDTISDQTRT